MSTTSTARPTPKSLRRTPASPSHEYAIVTPLQAQRWLELNGGNRRLREERVAQYARDMATGNWTVNNDDICFAPDGQLLNGQHRLTAVVQSGCAVSMGIKRNVPPESMRNMDTGAARTAGDFLGFAGEKNGPLLASVVRQAILVETGRFGPSTPPRVSNTEILDFLAAAPEIRQSSDAAMRAKGSIDGPPTAIAIAHWRIAEVNGGPDVADFYLDKLVSRAGEPEGSAVLAVDSRLRQIRRNQQKFPLAAYVYLFVKGWNYWAQNKPAGALSVTPRDDNYLPPVAGWARPA